MGLCTIKRSSEFQRVRGGARAANASFVIETRERTAPTPCAGPRLGFTITRKIGNAVVRNRIRRRFREALRTLEPGLLRARHDYVLVARSGVIEQPFAELRHLLETAVAKLHLPGAARPGPHAKRQGPMSARPNSNHPKSDHPKSVRAKPQAR